MTFVRICQFPEVSFVIGTSLIYVIKLHNFSVSVNIMQILGTVYTYSFKDLMMWCKSLRSQKFVMKNSLDENWELLLLLKIVTIVWRCRFLTDVAISILCQTYLN